MSKKYLLLLVFVMLLTIGVASASQNLTDDSVSADDSLSDSMDWDNNDGNDEWDDESGDDDYEEEDEDDDELEYYDQAILKPVKLSTTYNSGKTFNVKVVSAMDENYRLEDVELKLRVYTKGSFKDYYTTTDNDGIARFKVSAIALGTHNVVVSSVDLLSEAKAVSSEITIKKADTKVNAPKITAIYKKSKTFKITVKDKATKKAVKYVQISLKVGSKKYTLKTNSKGIASFKTKSLKHGKYKVTIKSKNANYNINGKSMIVII